MFSLTAFLKQKHLKNTAILNPSIAIVLFHMWNYKLTLKFRAKIKE